MRMLEQPLALSEEENREALRASERRSRYRPHQGNGEIERRRRQREKIEAAKRASSAASAE